MSKDNRTLSVLLHAASKVGKTTLGATSPFPICDLDAEGGGKFLPGSPHLTALLGRPLRVIEWDPSQPPPHWDGSWDVAMVRVIGGQAWQTVQRTYQWLQTRRHQFQTIMVDSISEIQRRAKQELIGTEQLKIQHWGQLLTVMDNVIRGFRDFTNDPYNPIRVAVFIAETRENQKGKFIPYMQGQISIALPYWMDIVGYLYVDQAIGLDPGTGQQVQVPVRKLLVAPHPQFEAGERVQGLVGPVIDEPNISTILEKVYPPAQAAQPQFYQDPASGAWYYQDPATGQWLPYTTNQTA
jgi:hypothetical protein